MSDVSVNEGAGTARVAVRLNALSDTEVSVGYTTSNTSPDVSAEAGEDYTAASGTASIAAGLISTVVEIPITQDTVYETDESFLLTLADPVNAALDSSSTATVTIRDDDSKPVLSISDAESDEESGPLVFTVERTGASAVAVSASWATADGTATSPSDFTGAGGTVTILPDQTTATISVALATDDDDESDETFDITLSNPIDSTLGTASATGTILDNDEPGGAATPRLVVAPKTLTVDEGDTTGASYTVRLESAPAGDVTVSVSGASGTDLAVSPATLEFTTSDWGTAQTVTVTAADDDDTSDDTATLSNTAAGGGYDGAAQVPVSVTVVDDDDPSLVVDPTSVTVDEGDTAGADPGMTYTVKLATQPTGAVEVTITGTASTEVSLDKSTLRFTSTDWNTAQTVRVTAGSDDGADDDEVTLTHTAAGGGYGSETETVAVNVRDDDSLAAGLLLDPASLTVSEGGAATYNVSLATEPTHDVEVAISGSAADLTVLSASPAVLTFTAADWNTAQTVTLTAGTDVDTADDEAALIHTATSDDASYDAVNATLPVTITDDGLSDHAALLVAPDALTMREGAPGSYTVRLVSQPSGDVTVTITGAAASDLSGVPGSLTFTDSNWNSEQRVTVTAGQDDDADDDEVTLTHTAAGGGYTGQSAAVAVTVVDDDTAAVTVPAAATVTEGQPGVAHEVRLATKPSADVTLTIGGVPDPDVTVDKTTLVFTADDWNTDQTVTITAVDDDLDEDGETVTLFYDVTSSDANYGGRSSDLVVSVVDDDTAAVTVPAAVTVTEGQPGVAHEVRLATKPSADVTLTIGGVPDPDVTVDKTTLVFTADNWNTDQTVTTTAVDDDLDEDGETVTLSYDITSSDANYMQLTITPTTTVTINDNDVPAVTVQYAAASYSVDEGSAVTVTVELSEAPQRSVTVPITTTLAGGAEGADYSGVPASVTFGATATTATFNLAAADDSFDDDGESIVLGLGAPPTGVSVGTVASATVTINDDPNDVPDVTVQYAAAAYSVNEGSAVTVTVELSEAPQRSVTVPITATLTGGVGRRATTPGCLPPSPSGPLRPLPLSILLRSTTVSTTTVRASCWAWARPPPVSASALCRLRR